MYDMNIKNKISKDIMGSGTNPELALMFGEQAQNLYEQNKDFLDCDFEQQFCNTNEIELRFDRLTELSYVNFLRQCGYTLQSTKQAVKSPSCLDVKINNLGYCEFNCLHSNDPIRSIQDLKARLTQGLDKKFVKAYMEIQKGNVPKNVPIILCFCYSCLLEKGALPIITDDICKDKIPLEVECLCGFNFKKQNGVEIEPRYFIDKLKWIGTDNKEIRENKKGLYKTREQKDKNGNVIRDKNGTPRIEVLVDTTYISAVVFSPCITNSVFNDILSETDEFYWDNDLILVHNPSAKCSVKKRPFPTYWEYYIAKRRIDDGYKIRVKEIHKELKSE